MLLSAVVNTEIWKESFLIEVFVVMMVMNVLGHWAVCSVHCEEE